ncbi:hypothetical protein DI09_100p90 [Mitosporidium daphniae]|uniref:Translation initiation factor eIF2B subunit delta n=1 Tax=Mitosporidium daphniae TaxID=1485682 RepID=A0A098VWF8_9MICR|nr:uncharacterized protein DI09_100p90 [Mitosporidium daphniae]KGG53245.1 hypothetical protein DI09_100p90 [Mitosporidium daphniae]|eukprot:XP_013239681.1 uncharacterized protein DI09_100p90 [Mitosporidium daphniae]
MMHHHHHHHPLTSSNSTHSTQLNPNSSPIHSPYATTTAASVRVSLVVSSASPNSPSPLNRKNSNPASSLCQIGGVPENIHPAVSQLSLLYSKHRIVGGNARCLALLRVFKKVIQDYFPPAGVSISRHLDATLKPQIAWLVKSRPLSISMAHAIRHLKWQIAHLPLIDHSVPESDSLSIVKTYLCQAIDSYLRERIELADELIVSLGINRIDGESLMVFSHSDVILDLLVAGAQRGKKFSLVVVDAGPLYEGQFVLKYLQQRLGVPLSEIIPTSYVPLSAIGHAFRIGSVTRVLLGAHCIYSNGNVQTRAGSSMIALMAHQANVPVIVCCETYKFSDKVQLATTLTHGIDDGSSKRSNFANLRISHSLHDIIPSKFVSMIITEMGMIPCTSVPVVIREYRPFPI